MKMNFSFHVFYIVKLTNKKNTNRQTIFSMDNNTMGLEL